MLDPARYSVGTWDTNKGAFTPQRGLSVPSFNCTIGELRIALKELRRMGYSAHRQKDPDSDSHDNNDSMVLVQRTDGMHWKEIMKDWRRGI